MSSSVVIFRIELSYRRKRYKISFFFGFFFFLFFLCCPWPSPFVVFCAVFLCLLVFVLCPLSYFSCVSGLSFHSSVFSKVYLYLIINILDIAYIYIGNWYLSVVTLVTVVNVHYFFSTFRLNTSWKKRTLNDLIFLISVFRPILSYY